MENNKNVLLKNKKGFTLVELLVTIAIIGLLSTLAVAAVSIARQKAKVAKAEHEINQIFEAITMLATDSGVWPGHQPDNTVCSDLPACPANNEFCGPDDSVVPNDCAGMSLSSEPAGIAQDDSSDPYKNWAGPYMANLPNDPWENEYFFDTDYAVDQTGKPLACNPTETRIDVVVVGSYGPNGISDLKVDGNSDCDDVIKIIK